MLHTVHMINNSITLVIAATPVTINFLMNNLQEMEGTDLTIDLQAIPAADALNPIMVTLQLMDDTAGMSS